MRAAIVLVIAHALLGFASATAQSTAQVPVHIETVASGGFWEVDDSTRGQFRVVIETGGFEHLISDAHVDWIAQPRESDAAPRLVASISVPEVTGGGVHLVDPLLSWDGKSWVLTIDAANTHCDPVRIDRWRMALGAPGKLTVLGSTRVAAGCD